MNIPSYFKLVLFVACIGFFSACNSSLQGDNIAESRIVSFNDGWSFHLNDSLQDNDTISNTTKWQDVKVPHDWSIEMDFDENSPTGHGGAYLTGGLGWYKKSFKISENDKDKRLSIVFDGVYSYSDVWVNNHYLGNRPNGYVGFEYDITPYVNFGDKTNEIIVRVNNKNQPNSRWYSGSGIYRNVWLKTTHKIHVAQWGTFITTPQVSAEKATVRIETDVKNETLQQENVSIVQTIYSDETVVATSEEKIDVNSSKTQKSIQTLTVENPKLWSDVSPTLYNTETKIYVGEQLVDTYHTSFGIRSFKFDLEKGFILNGTQVKIKGVCLHHDLGPLGAAVNTRAIQRQLEIMKEMGVNGIRTAHNPPAPELLDLCDQMGFIVMDEAFDIWEKNKNPFDYGNDWDDWHQKDLEDQILRDRNHASIFMWSIGNEIPEQWSERGAEIGRELSKIVKSLDTTRLVTAAMNPPIHIQNKEVTLQFEETAAQPNALAGSGALDIIGYNYAHQTYEDHQKNFPNTPFIATETTSGLQTRGHYDFPSDTTKIWPVRWDKLFTEGNADNTVSAYDQVRTPWGSLHETTWKIIKRNDYLSGFYIWTGFDYLGEPTPYVWPSRSSYFGIVDLAGFPKDVYYMYKSEWTNEPVLHLLPHWNWEQGQLIDVWAYYNNADEVELFLNGKSLGTKQKEGEDLHIMWRVPFEAGTLKAISRKNGKVVLEREIKTASEPAQLKLTADRNTIKADGDDLSFITVDILDADGNFVPTANNLIKFEVEAGDATIVAVANGDPTNHESFKGKQHKALNGKCLVVVQAGKTAGSVTLKVTADGLTSNTITLQLQ
ncbi:beta-galactosidase GalB [Joostella sp. CR20]|uniref:beta-galactosidase GalB n=1 Tax=Joostella sp. CR20 TaxID=2804312 RepID=UPI00313EB0D0